MNRKIDTGAKAIFKSFDLTKARQESGLVRFLTSYTGWFLFVFVVASYWLSPELSFRELRSMIWLLIFLIYLIVVELLSRSKPKLYESFIFRMVRVQFASIFGSLLIWMSGGAESYFWVFYFWPLFASTLYFSQNTTWIIYTEISFLYLSVSFLAEKTIHFNYLAEFFINLATLLVIGVVFRYLANSIKKHQATQRALDFFALSQQFQRDIDAAIGLQDVLDKILERAVHLVNAGDGSIMLVGDDGNLHFHSRVGGLFPDDKEERTFRPGEGVAGWVLQNKEPYICPDTRLDTKFSPIIDGTPIRSIITVPIIAHGTVIGVINVDSEVPERFTESESESLVALANQAAIAIERAELLEGFKEISSKVLSGADDLYDYIVEAVYRLTRCPVAMWLVDKTGKTARIAACKQIRTKHAQEAVVDLDSSVTGQAIHQRIPIPVLDIQSHPDFQNKEEAQRDGWKSMLVVPLTAEEERAVGTLNIYSKVRKEQFTTWEVNVLQTFASQAGSAIRSRDLIEETNIISAIGREISTLLDVKKIGNLLYQYISQMMGISNFFLALVDPQKEKLEIEVWIHDDKQIEPFSRDISGLTGWIVKKKKSVLIRDWDEEEMDFPVSAEIITNRQRSWLGVPLMLQDEVVGVLSIQSPEPHLFSADTQQFLETIAAQVAVAVQNTKLFEQQIEAIREISKSITVSLDLDTVLEGILEWSLELMGKASLGEIRLYDEGTDTLVSQVLRGEEIAPEHKQIPLGKGITGWVAQQKEMLYVPDVEEDEHYVEFLGETRSEIAVPMLDRRDDLIGVLNIEHPQVNAFSQNDLRRAKALANLAAIAIENVRLYEQRIKDISALQDINATITTDSKDKISDSIAQIAKDLMQAEYSGLWIAKGDHLALGAMSGRVATVEDEEPPEILAIDENSINGYVAKTNKPYVCSDAENDSHYFRWRSDIQSSMAVPMKWEKRLIGTLYVESAQLDAFSDYHVRMLQTLADQAAIAIQNARLFEQLERKVQEQEAVNQLGQILTAQIDLTEQQILELIYEQADPLMHTENMYVALYEQSTDLVRFPLMFVEGERQKVESRKAGAGRTEHIIHTKEPLLIFTEEESEAWYKEQGRKEYIDEPFASWLGVPMLFGEEVIGVIATYHKSEDFVYDQDDQEVLQAIASQAAIALRNIRYVDELDAFQDLAGDFSAGAFLGAE